MGKRKLKITVKFEKPAFMALAFLLAFGILAHAQPENDYDKLPIEEKREWINGNDLGINVAGDQFSYAPLSNTLKLQSGSYAQIRENFEGTAEISGGTVIFPDESVFSGKGYYSKSTGLIITEGYFNDAHIIHGNAISYDRNAKKITGIAGANCEVNDAKIGEGAEFSYSPEKSLIALKGKGGATTLPDAAIRREGPDYYIGKNRLDMENSEIYLAKGSKIEIQGFMPISADKGDVRLFFEKDGYQYKIKPAATAPYKVDKSANSMSDVFKQAGYGDNNFKARKEWYEKNYGDAYAGSSYQNTRALEDLKNGKISLYYEMQQSNVALAQGQSSPLPAAEQKKLNTDSEVYIGGVKFNAQIDYDPEKAIGADPKSYYLLTGDIEETKKNIKDNPDFLSFIRQKASERGLDEGFVIAICSVESHCNPKTGPYKGSYGPFQMKKITVRELNRIAEYDKYDWNEVKNNPLKNAEASIEYLSLLSKKYNGNVQLTAAAYNAGPTKVNLVRKVPENKITPKYVQKVMAYRTS